MNPALEKTLEQIVYQSEKEYSRLLRGKENGSVKYEPNPADIYIYQLQLEDSTKAYQTVKQTMLFASQESAVMYAVESIRKRYLDIPGLNSYLEALYTEGKYQELIDFVNDRLAYRQTISMVNVRSQ